MIDGIEIFSGAGGLATGLGLAGVNHKAFVEWNADACRTLRENYKSSLVHEGDVRDFNFSDFTDIDIIAGGPPCQPFSMGGKARGNKDARDMFPSAIRAVRESLPKAFLFENVKGLLRDSFSDYLDYILLQLQFPTITDNANDWMRHKHLIGEASENVAPSASYDVQIHLVNAADYGVPQRRERVVIVGIRKDLGKKWELPSPTHSLDSLLWDKYVTGSYWERHGIAVSENTLREHAPIRQRLEKKYGFFPPESKPWVTMRDAFVKLPSHDDAAYYPDEHNVRDGAKEYPGHTGSSIDEPSKTIKAGAHGVPGGENMVKFTDGSVRYLTVFEAKRIQTFPDNYKVTGSWTEAMRQLGNAVPVRLAHTIAESIINAIR